ncbi:MAG: NADH-quinone oxidoreductase subunit I [Chloroflexi bacterium]|nr:NADH-quinone oxidoreductase subunit I [Chloroflexota bacterium]
MKGMAVTLRHLLRRPFTVQYPEERLPLPERFRGNELIWLVEKCTGCNTCAKACPHGVIQVETSAKLDENRYFVEKFEADMGLCIFCGLCVEACPFEALYLSREFEKATYRHEDMFRRRDDFINAQKNFSGYFYPYLDKERPKRLEGW